VEVRKDKMEEEVVSVQDSEGEPIVGATVIRHGIMYRKRYGPLGFTPTVTGVTDEKGEVRDWSRER